MSWENWVLHGREKLFDLGILKNLIWKNVVGEVMGKTASALAVLGGLVGQIMAASEGRANPQKAREVLWTHLERLRSTS